MSAAQNKILARHQTSNSNNNYQATSNPYNSSRPQNQTNNIVQGNQSVSQTSFKQVEPEDPYLNQRLEAYNSPSFVKMTTDTFPREGSTYNKLTFPLCAIQTPFHYPFEIPCVTDLDPIRCTKCRCFVNPYWEWKANGEIAKCNICSTNIKIDDKHYVPQGESGLPRNFEERPELYTGTYEYKVGEEFSSRPPTDPTYLFLIDVSASSLETGVPYMVFSCIRKQVEEKRLNGEEKARFGILCFDSRIHLITLNPYSHKPKVTTMVGNFDQCPIPLSSILMCIEDFSDPEVFAQQETIPDSFHRMNDLTKAVPIRSLTLISNMLLRSCGGRAIMVLANDVMDWGDALKIPTGQQPRNMFLPSNNQFGQQGINLSLSQISFDFFIFGRNKPRNLITMMNLARYVCCDINYYPDTTEDQINKFYNEFWSSMLRKYAWETGIRCRMSEGWVKKTHGNYNYKTSDLMSPSVVDENYTFMIEFSPGQGCFTSTQTFALQLSFLYTNENRERMLRVVNHAVRVSNNIQEVVQGIDSQTITNALMKKYLSQFYQQTALVDINMSIFNAAKKIFLQYQQLCAKQVSEEVEDASAFMPQQVLGLMKHPIFCMENMNTLTYQVDLKNVLRINLEKFTPHEINLQLNPWMFRIDVFGENQGEYTEDYQFNYPDFQGLNFGSLSYDGIFLLNDGFDLQIYVGQSVSPQTLKTFFGVENINEVPDNFPEESMFPDQNDPIAIKVTNLQAELRNKMTTKYQHIQVFVGERNTPTEVLFFYRLYEEKYNGYVGGYYYSYEEFYTQFTSSNQRNPMVM